MTRPLAEPYDRFRRWFAAARRAGEILPEAVSLATATRDGAPSVRIVLLKEVDERGFVVYTNLDSRKGEELAENPRAALAFHWKTTRRQVRVEGVIEEVDPAESDAYWQTRPRTSRIAGYVSKQSHPVRNRETLVTAWEKAKKRFAGQPIPRPDRWTGIRILPDEIELWTHRASRLHDRELYRRTRSNWHYTRLQP